MRIIKFRGLRTDGKGWVYGMLFHNNKIVTETVSYESPLVEKGSPCYKYEYINIIPETVGQFTGLHDKNGKEIYEGDIVSYKHTIQNYDDDDILNPRHYKTPQYETKIFKSDVKYRYNSFIIMDDSKWNDLEVIGNIYENPELLTD